MNSTLPPLPEYQLRPLEPLIPGIRDDYLSLALLVVAYWSLSGVFHLIDVYDLFPQYRLHTPEEVLKRNHVSRWDVFRDVILQQIIQTVFGVCLGMLDGPQMTGKEGYDIAVWARRIRMAQHALPGSLALIGLDARGLSKNIASTHPILSGVLAGGKYAASADIPQFASWELTAAKAIYYLLVPALQFVGAVMVVDTWQYFWHRAMHVNKWMYSKLLTPTS